MSWELEIKTPDGSTQKAAYTNSDPAGIFGEFRWSVDGTGSPKQLLFHAKPSEVDIGPRDIISLTVNSSIAFTGYIVKTHPSNDTQGREYLALGLRQLLRSLYVPWSHYTYRDTGSGIFDELAKAAADALPLSYTPGSTSPTGWKLEVAYPGTVDYYTALDDVVRRTPGYIWGVDVNGVIFMREPTSVVEVPYSAPGVRWLPVLADDVVTKVIGWAGYYARDDRKAESYRDGSLYQYIDTLVSGKWPLTARMALSDEHDLYGAEKAFAIPTIDEGSSDVLHRLFNEGRVAVWPRVTEDCVDCLCSNPNSYEALFDGDSNTYVEIGIKSTGTGRIYITDPDVIGDPEYSSGNVNPTPPPPRGFWPLYVKSLFELPDTDTQYGVGGKYYAPELTSTSSGWSILAWSSGLTAGTKHTIELRKPPPLGAALMMELTTPYTSCTIVKVYSFEASGIVIYSIKSLGESLLRTPHQQVAEVIIDGYKPPTDYLRVSGAPGGDVYSRVEEIEYVWSPEAQITTIRNRRRQPESASAIVQAAERARMGAVTDGSIAMKR